MKVALLILASLGLALAALSFAPQASRAETVYLKGGSKLTGKIIEQNDDAVKLEVAVEGGGSAVITIKRSRIDRIEAADSFDERVVAANRRLEMNMFAEAERDFRELVREKPRHSAARMGLARALYGQKKLAEAIKTLDHYLILVTTSRDPQLLLLAGELRMYRGDYSEAKALAREAAALDPANASLREAAAALARRVERYRDGTEAAEQKAAAQKAELEKRAEARANYDRTTGNNYDACEAAAELFNWIRQSDQSLVASIKINITADTKAENYFLRGGDAEDYRRAVEMVTATITVNESDWLRMQDHIKHQQVYGFYYQLRERYPRTAPVITIVKRDSDERGRARQTDLARGSWDGKRARIVVELWTPQNIDKTRAAGLKNGKR